MTLGRREGRDRGWRDRERRRRGDDGSTAADGDVVTDGPGGGPESERGAVAGVLPGVSPSNGDHSS